MIIFVTLSSLFGAGLCVPIRHAPPKVYDEWWTDMEATQWDDKGPQLENSPFYNTFRQMDKQLDMYGYAQHVGKINRGKYYYPELNLPRHRAFGHNHDYNAGDLKSGAFRHSPRGQEVVAEDVHVELGMATSVGEFITVAPGLSINSDGTIDVETIPGPHPCDSNPCVGVFPRNKASCVAVDATTAKCSPLTMTMLHATCDNTIWIYLDGKLSFKNTQWAEVTSVPIPAGTRVLGISCQDYGGLWGIVASTDSGVLTDASWSCSSKYVPGWAEPDFQDTHADFSSPHRGNNYIQGTKYPVPEGIASEAESIWGQDGVNSWAYCRKYLV